ncbi:hypothetical protein PIB30_101738 [Stylosanthes scabra]|uniref:Uncharacterized protein n=1 Tax=Stylosanthes scabra TaxID=79078 RepID=A0ABU6XWM6_9FABA|nr:hypothetical protein [Stylosanthes scabra]
MVGHERAKCPQSGENKKSSPETEAVTKENDKGDSNAQKENGNGINTGNQKGQQEKDNSGTTTNEKGKNVIEEGNSAYGPWMVVQRTSRERKNGKPAAGKSSGGVTKVGTRYAVLRDSAEEGEKNKKASEETTHVSNLDNKARPINQPTTRPTSALILAQKNNVPSRPTKKNPNPENLIAQPKKNLPAHTTTQTSNSILAKGANPQINSAPSQSTEPPQSQPAPPNQPLLSPHPPIITTITNNTHKTSSISNLSPTPSPSPPHPPDQVETMMEDFVPAIAEAIMEDREEPEPDPPDLNSIDSIIMVEALVQYEENRLIPENPASNGVLQGDVDKMQTNEEQALPQGGEAAMMIE